MHILCIARTILWVAAEYSNFVLDFDLECSLRGFFYWFFKLSLYTSSNSKAVNSLYF